MVNSDFKVQAWNTQPLMMIVFVGSYTIIECKIGRRGPEIEEEEVAEAGCSILMI
jgi:hypothetical protein